MRTRNADPNPHRKSSADNPRSSNTLEPDSSFFLRRRKTNRSSQPDDSEPVSPRFGAAPSRGTHHSAGSNKSNLEPNANSATSSLSLGSKFPPNVSDWNEKVQRDTTSSRDVPPRQSADPPRPAREGFEWVWFPEGYWAERERLASSVKKQKSRKWFAKSPDRESNSLSPSKTRTRNKTPPDIDIPQIKIGSTNSNGSSSRTSQKIAENTDTPGSKFKKGIQYVSPTHPHFTSPTGQPEGLYCKVRRGIETQIMNKPQMCLDNSTTEVLAALPSRTTLLLEGTSSYFDQKQCERNGTDRAYIIPATPQTPASTDSRARRVFGLAPWHRRSSQESLLSVSSSVHRLLMGKAPAATPRVEGQYTDHKRKQHDRVEISEPGQPNFLPSEARRISTPSMSRSSSPTSPRGFLFDLTPSSEKPRPEPESSQSNLSTGTYPPRQSRGNEVGYSQGWWEVDNRARAEAAKGLARQQRLEIEMSLPPEHLPGSPLCPKSPMHKSKGRGICVYHGRRRSVSLQTMDGGDSPCYTCDYCFYEYE